MTLFKDSHLVWLFFFTSEDKKQNFLFAKTF